MCSLQTGRTDSACILRVKPLTVKERTQQSAIKLNAMSTENFYKEKERSGFFNLTLNINNKVHMEKKLQHKMLIKFSVQLYNTSEVDPTGLPFVTFHSSFPKGTSHNVL